MPNNRLAPLAWVWHPVWEILDPPLYSEPIVSVPFSTATESPPRCYRPQRSCGQGYVFTRVCDSVHRGGSPGRENPPGLGEPLPRAGRTPPGQGENPPGADPPWNRHPPGAETFPLPPRAETPPGADSPRSRHPPPGSILQHTVNERPVRILLECILVPFFVLFCRADLSSHYGVRILVFLLEYGY